jgi:hypothetical protein
MPDDRLTVLEFVLANERETDLTLTPPSCCT